MNYYVGLSLASGSSMDSGVAVIDEDNNCLLYTSPSPRD